jgi:hypothetical protein
MWHQLSAILTPDATVTIIGAITKRQRYNAPPIPIVTMVKAKVIIITTDLTTITVLMEVVMAATPDAEAEVIHDQTAISI